MTVSSNHLDSLLHQTFGPLTLTGLSFETGTAANGAVTSLTGRTGTAPYASENSMTVTSVTDASNIIVLTGAFGSTQVPWDFTVVGESGKYLLLASADGSAATQALPAATVAADIQNGQTSNLSGNLFVFAMDNSTVAAGQDLTFSPLVTAPETVASVLAATPASAVTVTDTAAAVQNGLDGLQGLSAAGKISAITLTDSGIPTLSLSVAQITADTTALKAITTDYTAVVDGSAANITVAGIAGRGTVVKFTGPAADYTITPSGDGVHFTVTDSGTGRTSVDHLSGITALQFGDGTDFVAQAPSATQITTGNVTELYSAVLARTPDVAGLAFYQAEISTNPALSLNQLAQSFLSAPEYTNNSAHNYAQSAAGDAQFINDTYSNLLHRAPETGAVAFYQNVIAQFTAGLTAGTSAYAAAALAGHAQVLVNFSASAEFLNDVQITAQHPADAQHFLYLI